MSRAGRGLPPIPPQDESPYAELIHADILLPTGMMLTLNCHKSSTLAEMKNNIWQEARSYPLFDHMKHQGFYSFIGAYFSSRVSALRRLRWLHGHGGGKHRWLVARYAAFSYLYELYANFEVVGDSYCLRQLYSRLFGQCSFVRVSSSVS